MKLKISEDFLDEVSRIVKFQQEIQDYLENIQPVLNSIQPVLNRNLIGINTLNNQNSLTIQNIPTINSSENQYSCIDSKREYDINYFYNIKNYDLVICIIDKQNKISLFYINF